MDLAIVAWLMDVVPNLSTIAGLGILVLVICGFLVGMSLEMGDLSFEKPRRALFLYVLSICTLALVAGLTPSRDGMKLIVGAYLAQTTYEKVLTIDGVEQLPENAVRYMNNFFKEVDNPEAEEE